MINYYKISVLNGRMTIGQVPAEFRNAVSEAVDKERQLKAQREAERRELIRQQEEAKMAGAAPRPEMSVTE